MHSRFEEINQRVKSDGFQSAVRSFIRTSGTKIVHHFPDEETKKNLKNSPVVLLCNHPYIFEVPILVSSLPDRNDISIVVNAILLNIIKNIDPYLIPVYINNNMSNPLGKLLSKIFTHFHKSSSFTKEEESKKNKESMALAVENVKKGGLVILFPSPGLVRTGNEWFPGIGYMVHDFDKEKSVYIVEAYITGSSLLDFLRFIPKIGVILPTFTIYFSKPKPLCDIAKLSSDPKKLTKLLERDYNDWVRTVR